MCSVPMGGVCESGSSVLGFMTEEYVRVCVSMCVCVCLCVLVWNKKAECYGASLFSVHIHNAAFYS